MDAKEVGEKVKEFAEKLVEENVQVTKLRMDENTLFIDHLGTALIMQGCMLMLEAGCPTNIVLSRAVGCVKGFQKKQAVEATKPVLPSEAKAAKRAAVRRRKAARPGG